jgi:hypothetical protein
LRRQEESPPPDKDKERMRLAEQEHLGDPSGKSSAEYWNDWFQTISPDGNFEWYCDTSEIARILLLYCDKQRKQKEELNIIHPGIVFVYKKEVLLYITS